MKQYKQGLLQQLLSDINKGTNMQVTINTPDNLPQAFIQQQIQELEERLRQQAYRLMTNTSNIAKEQAIMQISERCAGLPELDHRSCEEILGYEDSPMGLWGDE